MNTTRTTLWACASVLAAFILPLAGINSVIAQPGPALDANFKPAITHLGGFGSAVGVQGDGKVVLAGAFNAVDGLARQGIVRLNPDGTVDPAFETGAICCGFSSGGGTEPVAAISALAI